METENKKVKPLEGMARKFQEAFSPEAMIIFEDLGMTPLVERFIDDVSLSLIGKGTKTFLDREHKVLYIARR